MLELRHKRQMQKRDNGVFFSSLMLNSCFFGAENVEENEFAVQKSFFSFYKLENYEMPEFKKRSDPRIAKFPNFLLPLFFFSQRHFCTIRGARFKIAFANTR